MIRETPLIAAPSLGAAVYLKLECLQRTGSFKLRGATAAIAALSADARAVGVVTASAGNHGAGLALAGHAAGVPVTVVVPRQTPDNKRRRISDLGAELVVDGELYDDSEIIARELAAARGAVFVSPFDDDAVLAGNGGSLAAELRASCPELGRVIVPVGGGGLFAGAAQALGPVGVDVVGVEPESNCAMRDSLKAGMARLVYDGGETCAEGCEGAVAQRTFEIVRDHGAGVELVSEDAIRDAVRFLYRDCGVIAECSGAVAVAALRTGAVQPRGVTVAVVTGGNIDDDALDALLAG